MPERPDLRRIATDIREALGTYPPEALVDILTYVFQAYVVEGSPTVHAPPAERLADLEGLSFAEVIQQLQLRLEVPELALFEVQNGRVSVRVGGELVALMLGTDARRAVATPLPAAPAVQTAYPSQVSAPGPAPRPAAPATTEAPRPTRGVSVNPSAGSAARPAAPAQAAPAQPGAKPAAPGGSTEDPGDDDAASKRFRLIEID